MLKKFLRNTIVLIVIFIIPGCGGGGSGGGNVPITPQAKTLSNIKVANVTNGGVNDPVSVVTTPSGTTFSYFASAPGALPTQAQVSNVAGVTHTVFYATDGTISKIVDKQTGNFMIFHPRSDNQGMEYLTFNSTGNFVEGIALFVSNGAWNTAPILGLASGSTAANFGSAVYGPMSPVDANVAALFTPASQVVVMNENLIERGFDLIIPSAYAATIMGVQITDRDVYNLIRGGAALGAGALAVTAGMPIVGGLMVYAGTTKLLGALANIQSNNVNTLNAVINNLTTNEPLILLNSGLDPLASASTFFGEVKAGVSTLATKAVNAGYTLGSSGAVIAINTLGNVADFVIPVAQASADQVPGTLTMPTSNAVSSMPVSAPATAPTCTSQQVLEAGVCVSPSQTSCLFVGDWSGTRTVTTNWVNFPTSVATGDWTGTIDSQCMFTYSLSTWNGVSQTPMTSNFLVYVGSDGRSTDMNGESYIFSLNPRAMTTTSLGNIQNPGTFQEYIAVWTMTGQ
jgi:hypothetical protein